MYTLKLFIPLALLCICTHASAQKTDAAKQDRSTTAQNAAGTLKLYPNPAKTYTNIYVDWNSVQSFTISIYDLQFNTNLTDIPVNSRKNYQYSLDVSKLPPGKYRITVKSATAKLEEILTVSTK